FPFLPLNTVIMAFFFYCSVSHRDLHSFPTRRSSDLICILFDPLNECLCHLPSRIFHQRKYTESLTFSLAIYITNIPSCIDIHFIPPLHSLFSDTPINIQKRT